MMLFRKLKLPVLLLAFLLMVSVWVRFVHLGDHFTHVDSVFMIMDILKAKDPGFKTTMMQRAFDQTRPAYNSLYKRVLRKMGSDPRYQPLLDAAFKLSPYFIVSVTSTNAPLQFLFNVPLIHAEQSYRQLMFWGRFPSFIFSLIAILGILLFIKLLNEKDLTPMILSMVFLGFSWQHIIYAKQLYQYSFIAMACLLLLPLFVYILKGRNTFLFSVIIPVLLTYGTYQVYFMMPPFYLSLLWIFYRQKNWGELKKTFIYMIAYGFLILPSVIYNYLYFWGSASKYYQIGPHGEFLFRPWLISGFLAKLIYIPKFFLVNTFLALRANLCPYPVETGLGKIISLGYFIFFILGIYAVLKSKNQLVKNTGLYAVATIFFWYLTTLTGEMPLSPCRLSLAYLGIFVFLSSYGLKFLLEKYIPPERMHATITIIVIVISLIFGFSYSRVMHNRLDPISETEIAGTVDKYKIQTILGYNFSQNIHLMTKTINKVNYFEEDYPRPAKIKTPWRYKSILYFSTRTPLSKKVFNELKEQINRDVLIKEKWRNNYEEYRQITIRSIDTDVQVEFTKDNINPTNDLYLTVLQLK